MNPCDTDRPKDMKIASLFIIAACIFGGVIGALSYMDSRYQTTEACEALSVAVGQEMPGALDEFGAKYPLAGLIRLGVKLFDSGNQADKLAQQLTEAYIRDQIDRKKNEASGLMCFGLLVVADLNRSAVRQELVVLLEREFAPRQGAPQNATVYLKNTCDEEISVSMVHKDEPEAWVTQGWWNVEPNGAIDTQVDRKGGNVYIYAKSRSHTWNGVEQKDSVSRYIVDNGHLIPDGKRLGDAERYLASYFKVEFDAADKSLITFSCD